MTVKIPPDIERLIDGRVAVIEDYHVRDFPEIRIAMQAVAIAVAIDCRNAAREDAYDDETFWLKIAERYGLEK